MTEQTQTEKLDNLMEPILVKVYNMALHSNGEWIVRRDTLLWAKEETRKACKEAGLKFIPDTIANACGDRPTWFENVEEIEISREEKSNE